MIYGRNRRRRVASRIIDRRYGLLDNMIATRASTGEYALNLENSKESFLDDELMPKEISLAKFKDRVTVGDTIRWVCGNTRHELHMAIAQVLIEEGAIKLGESKCTVPTVREFVEQVFRKTYVNPLAPKTVANYNQYLKNNILPFLGDMRLDEVSVSTIQDFYNWMAQAEDHGRKKNLNRRSIERIGGLTSRIFKVALEMKLIDDTPFKNTLLAIRAENAGHHKALSDEEMMHVKQEIPKMESERERLYMGLLAYTGMRLEEILGLCWENINLQGKFCRVQRTVTYPKNSKPVVRECGKTEYSIRTVILPEPLVQILTTASARTGFVLGGSSPLCYSTYHRMYKSAFKKLNIENYTNHDFRTTYATQICESGISAKQVADLLGHADTRMVETVYARRRHSGVMKHADLINQLNSSFATST